MKQKQLSLTSKVKDVYQNPVGHDIINRLLAASNKKESLINNPLVRNMPIKSALKSAFGKMDENFFNTFIHLLNTDPVVMEEIPGEVKKKWWKESVVYQIYPRSFYDSNGDGIGDIKGILHQLDYLQSLGVNVLWLCPIYDSPNDDNGYDIRDYYKIMSEFGTMEDFEQLLYEVHERDMYLIMDLVINHTSDEHQWFQDALHNPNSKYKDFYHFRKSSGKVPPNNWTSFFGGPAWKYYGEKEEWALHTFSNKQMDLNWDNAKVRKTIYEMIRWWLEKGVDGFRLDVINFISKEPGLPNGNEVIGDMMGYRGIEHYFYGPNLHSYLKEMREKTFSNYDVFTVGETPGVGLEMAKRLTADTREELDMIFTFDHLDMPGKSKYDTYQYDLNYLKEYYIKWMEQFGSRCWMPLFFNNHDNPRMLSKISKDLIYRVPLAKLLAMIQFTLMGTPFIYQGDELGLVNQRFSSIERLQDIETRQLYEEWRQTMGEYEAFQRVLSGSRDHARTPMPWDSSLNAGFTEGEPWIGMDDDHKMYNVEAEIKDDDSVLRFYRSLIALRKVNPGLVYGKFEVVKKEKKDLFLYYREYQGVKYYVECNLSSSTLKRVQQVNKMSLMLSTYGDKQLELRPYEANLYVVK